MQDLSIVTDTLRGFVTAALAGSPVWGGGPPPFSVGVSGQHPEKPSSDDCELNLYLFHVSADKYLANSFWTQASQSGGGVGKQPVAFEPLSIDLWYMLSTQSKVSYTQEQQVLGVAMQALHEHGTFALPTATPPPGSVVPSHATLVLESPTFDELSRLWQAFGLPLRTTAQYRVSVVFLFSDVVPAPAPPVQEVVLTADPVDLSGDPTLPRLLGTRRTVHYIRPGLVQETYEQSPASLAPAPAAVAGQEVRVDGLMLDDADRILLVSHAGPVVTETDVTVTWKVALAPPYGSPPAHGVPFILRAPEGTPTPAGTYELTVSRPGLPGFRADPVPLRVAPWVDPGPGPEITAAGGVYTLGVRAVPATGATLQLGTVPLVRIADGAAPGPGQWQHSANTITFAAPTGTPAGTYPVGLRVADVESDPALWAVV